LADQYRLSYAAQIARRLPPYVPPSELQIQKSRPEGRLFIWLPPYDFAQLSPTVAIKKPSRMGWVLYGSRSQI
jgi:hypothetical protein